MRLIDADELKRSLSVSSILGTRETLEQLIDSQPTVGEWIPCSERQPEEAGLYQVTNTKPGARRVDWNIWMPECEWLYDTGVIAWMNLPEPYEG